MSRKRRRGRHRYEDPCKTPRIIRDELGEEIYNKFEEIRKSFPISPPRQIVIYTGLEGERIMREAILAEIDRMTQEHEASFPELLKDLLDTI